MIVSESDKTEYTLKNADESKGYSIRIVAVDASGNKAVPAVINLTVDDWNAKTVVGEFELRKIVNDQDEGTKIDTVTVTEGTKFNFKGLDAGKYKLIETVTPSGYNTIQPIIFTIEATYDEESDDRSVSFCHG